MNKLSRIQAGNQILKYFYHKNASLGDEQIGEQFYRFLLKEEKESITLCFQYDISLKQLEIYKKDMMLEILLSCYEYLSYVRTFAEISSVEIELLKDLDTIPFSLQNLYDYFCDAKNEEKIRKAIIDYMVYSTQNQDFKQLCFDYNLDEPHEFSCKLSKYISYIEAADMLVSLYEEIDNQYQEILEEGEEDEEEENLEGGELLYWEEVQGSFLFENEQLEVFSAVLYFLENFYGDKFDMDDFIGYFMSIVYAILLEQQKKGALTLMDQEMLKLLSRKDFSFEFVVESFWYSKEYVFDAVALFSREYHKHPKEIFSFREQYKIPFITKRFHLLDPFYEKPKGNYSLMYWGGPITPLLEEILNEKREISPTTYKRDIYKIMTDKKEGESVFTEKKLEQKNVPFYQNLMKRYLARKFLEEVASKPIGILSLEEMNLYFRMMKSRIEYQDMQELFQTGYSSFIDAYFKIHDQGQSYEKGLIRHLLNQNLLEKIAKIDPKISGDSIYLKTVNESPFYRQLEEKGIPDMILELQELSRKDPASCQNILKEILVMNYYYEKDHQKEEISTKVMELLEGDALLDSFYQEILEEKDLLRELLTRYQKEETDTKWPLSYEERVEFIPKIKQKLYPEKKKTDNPF